MRLFKHIVNRYSAPQVIFFQALFVLSLPNICLSFTEPLPLVGRLVNIILPVSLYMGPLAVAENRPNGVVSLSVSLPFSLSDGATLSVRSLRDSR